MLVRLLLALLVMTGPVPNRPCTCSAADHASHHDSETTDETARQERTESNPSAVDQIEPVPGLNPLVSKNKQHDHHCPAGNIQPDPSTVTGSASIAHAIPASGYFGWPPVQDSSFGGLDRWFESRGGGSVPIYISHSTLRN